MALASESVFAALGVALYMETVESGTSLLWLIAATGCIGGIGAALYLLQRRGLFALAGLIARRAAGFLKLDLALDGADGIDDHIRLIYRRRSDVLATFSWRLATWVAGSGEIWIAARGLSLSIGLGDALILESLSQTVRTAGFVMPAGLGLQEGVLVLLGPQLGINAESALALAQVRRARELAFGIPALLASRWLQLAARRRLPQSPLGASVGAERNDRRKTTLSGTAQKY